MNISEFKNAATFYKKGMIIPNQVIKIMRGNKKQKSKFKSNGCYVLWRGGVMYVTPQNIGEPSIIITGVKRVWITLNPYSKTEPHQSVIDDGDGRFELLIRELT